MATPENPSDTVRIFGKQATKLAELRDGIITAKCEMADLQLLIYTWEEQKQKQVDRLIHAWQAYEDTVFAILRSRGVVNVNGWRFNPHTFTFSKL